MRQLFCPVSWQPSIPTPSVSIYMPSNRLSSGWTGTMRYALSKSSFANRVPFPGAITSCAAISTVVYDREHSAGAIPSFTLHTCPYSMSSVSVLSWGAMIILPMGWLPVP